MAKIFFCPLCSAKLVYAYLEEEYDCEYCKKTFQINTTGDWSRMEWLLQSKKD